MKMLGMQCCALHVAMADATGARHKASEVHHMSDGIVSCGMLLLDA